MSVLVRDMEIPTACDKCRFCVNGFTDDAPMYECTASGDDMTSVLVDDHGKPFDFRPDWCPLIDVKDLIEYGNNLISLHQLYPQELLNIYEQAIKDMQEGISKSMQR